MAETGTPLELPPENALAGEAEQKGFWKQLKRGLFMTHTEMLGRLDAALSGRDFLDERVLEQVEETLISADLGVTTSLELVERLKDEVLSGDGGDAYRLRQRLADEVGLLLLQAPRPREGSGPRVTLVVGVNGVGKTTSIAKLGRLAQRQGRQVLLVAGDTFRAAAVEQLTLW